MRKRRKKRRHQHFGHGSYCLVRIVSCILHQATTSASSCCCRQQPQGLVLLPAPVQAAEAQQGAQDSEWWAGMMFCWGSLMWRDLDFLHCYLNSWGQQLGNPARRLRRLLQHKQSLLLQIQQRAKPVRMSGCSKQGFTPSKVQFTNKNCFQLNTLFEISPISTAAFQFSACFVATQAQTSPQSPTDSKGREWQSTGSLSPPGTDAPWAQQRGWVSQHLECGAHFHVPPVQKN